MIPGHHFCFCYFSALLRFTLTQSTRCAGYLSADVSHSSLQPSCPIWGLSHKSTTVVLHLCLCACLSACTVSALRTEVRLPTEVCVRPSDVFATIRSNRRRIYFCPHRCPLCSGSCQDDTEDSTVCPEETPAPALTLLCPQIQTLLLFDSFPYVNVSIERRLSTKVKVKR